MGMKLLTSDLRRILRLAISHNIFEEPQPEFIAHNRMSLLFLEDETILGWVGMFTTDLLLPIANTVPAMKRWPGSQESNETVSSTLNEPRTVHWLHLILSGREFFLQPLAKFL